MSARITVALTEAELNVLYAALSGHMDDIAASGSHADEETPDVSHQALLDKLMRSRTKLRAKR